MNQNFVDAQRRRTLYAAANNASAVMECRPSVICLRTCPAEWKFNSIFIKPVLSKWLTFFMCSSTAKIIKIWLCPAVSCTKWFRRFIVNEETIVQHDASGIDGRN